MIDINETKQDARATFYVSCLLGFLPLAAHMLVASAVSLGFFPVEGAIDLRNQNWLGHLIFVAIAVGSGTLLNISKVDKKWSRRLMMNFFHLFFFTVILWLAFGTMAVMGTPSYWVAYLAIGLLVAVGTIFAYIVDMEIAILRSNGGGENGA